MANKWLFGLAIVALLAACTAPAVAQERTGKILGTVTDQSGAVVPDAKIVATSPTLPKALETTSDSLGNFILPSVPIGVYTLSATKTGFNSVRQEDISVTLGAAVTFNPRLSVGQVTEVIQVTESAALLETASSRTSTNITQIQFENLAKGRTFNSILALAPGVRAEVKGGSTGVGGISVDGASGSENAFIVDGVDVTDVMIGALRSQYALPLEFVSEVQVKSGGFEAEYGGATGGVVNVATRAGRSEYHGELNFQWTNNQMNARDRGFWQRFGPQNLADFFRPKEDNYRIFYPGAALGGPILKNRVHFFAAYQPELERTERIVAYAPPTGTRQFTQEPIRHYGFGRVDFNPTSKLQVNSSWIWSPQRIKGTLPNRDPRVAPPTNDLSIQGGFVPSQAYTASANYLATPKLLLSARYGYRYLNRKENNYGISGAPYVVYQTSSSSVPGVPPEFAGSTGFRNVSSTFGIVRDITTRHNVYVDGSYTANLFGHPHTFKAGYAVNRVFNDIEDDYTNGYFLIYWGDAFSRGSINNQRGTLGYYTWEDGVRHNAKVQGHNQGFYIQDNWRVHPRFTVNAGVRFENEFLPPYTKEVRGIKVANPIQFGWGDKVAPRLGTAWDILGNGKWKLSGSFGLFYDVMKYNLALGSFGGDYWFTHVYRLDNPNVFGLSKANPGALGAKIVSFDNRTIPINERGELEGIDPHIKPYESREFTVTLEHQLASRLSAAIRYSRKDLMRTIEDIGVLSGDDEVYLIGNPGFGLTRDPKSPWGGKTPNGQEFLVPKARREYNGVEFRVQGQPTRAVQLIASYTYSRLYGNYAGLANSDEAGRSNPNNDRSFDSPYYFFDASGSQKNVFGRLSLDRPHVFKLFGSYELKTLAGSTFFGLNQVAYSGTPDSTSVIYSTAPTFPFGRGDMGRTPAYTQTDLYLAHAVKLSERTSLKFEANVRNLLNQATVLSRVTQINRASAITQARLPVSKFFQGYKLSDFVFPGSTAPPYNSIYGLPAGGARNAYRHGGGPDATFSSAFNATFPNFSGYQDFRVIRLGIRLIF